MVVKSHPPPPSSPFTKSKTPDCDIWIYPSLLVLLLVVSLGDALDPMELVHPLDMCAACALGQ